jgi:hypothetical protein
VAFVVVVVVMVAADTPWPEYVVDVKNAISVVYKNSNKQEILLFDRIFSF